MDTVLILQIRSRVILIRSWHILPVRVKSISGIKSVPCLLPLPWSDATGRSSEGRVISESPTETEWSWCFWITGSVGQRHHWTSREPTTQLCVSQSSQGISHDCQMWLWKSWLAQPHTYSNRVLIQEWAPQRVAHTAQTLWCREQAPRDWSCV